MRFASIGSAALAVTLFVRAGQCESNTLTPVTVTFVGDIMLDGGPGHLIANNSDPFADTAPYLLGSDVRIGNLECAITRKGHAEDKTYTFKAPKAALPLLKRYFNAVSLANNHSGDWGKAGFVDELTLLNDTQLAYFGGGHDEQEARKPFVIEVAGQRIAVLGYNEYPPRSFQASAHTPGTAWLIEDHVLSDIRTARQKSRADWVILYLHWGEEMEPLPSPSQVALASRLIDGGADAVIGSHPHVTQTVEWYHGKPIVYSLGNFMFDYFPGDPPLWTSYLLQLRLLPGKPPQLATIPIELDAAGVPHVIRPPTDAAWTEHAAAPK